MRNSPWLRLFACITFAAALAAGCSDDEGAADDGGGLAGAHCDDDHFCDYPDGSACGIADGAGICQPRPTVCVPVIDEVCGCDGERYSSPCDAQREGVDVAQGDAC
jgi:hypothetical protein